MYARWLSCSKPEAGCDQKTSKDLSCFKTFETVERRRAASWKTVQAILWLGGSNVCSKYCNATSILTDHYFQSNLILKVLLLQVLALGMRTKLYSIWSLTEGACIVSGIGYEGIDAETGSGRWDEIQNVNPWSLETAQNAHAFVGNWNMRVHNWLYHYVYIRVTPEGKKPGLLASMATFLVSAIWHGYWPGFYLTFVLSSLVHVVAKGMHPTFLCPKRLPLAHYEIKLVMVRRHTDHACIQISAVLSDLSFWKVMERHRPRTNDIMTSWAALSPI